MALVLFLFLPRKEDHGTQKGSLRTAVESLFIVIRNPQSILCGFIAGLLFIPTTIFDMTWGVRYLQDAHSLDYAQAVVRSATVPLGWIIGCPLFGFISDRLGRRKPVIIAGALLLGGCLAWILFGTLGTFPRYSIGFLAGVASGAAMLPYTIIREANPRKYGGTTTGVISCLNFTSSALLGPIFAWLIHHVSNGAEVGLRHYQVAFAPLLLGVICAILLTLLLKETGAGRAAFAGSNRKPNDA
jgi:MFS family permease